MSDLLSPRLILHIGLDLQIQRLRLGLERQKHLIIVLNLMKTGTALSRLTIATTEILTGRTQLLNFYLQSRDIADGTLLPDWLKWVLARKMCTRRLGGGLREPE